MRDFKPSNSLFSTRALARAGVATLPLAAALFAAPAMSQSAGTSQTQSSASQGAAVPATPSGTVAESGDVNTNQADVVVTGSRISRPDLVSSSPIATISGEALKVNNAITVEQLLQVNPQFQPNLGQSSNNPGSGAATVDLRGLGSNRTLVLIDGKRAPAYDTTQDVDVNIIPTALIKRIDILTGGASTVYGSDAVAGVVNFILDDRFVGLRADASNQISDRGDVPIYDVSLTAGVKFGDRGNLVMSGGYSKRGGITFGDRPDEAVALSSQTLGFAGSSNTVPTAFDIPGAGRQQVQPNGTLSPNVVGYNYESVNLAVIPLERYNFMGLARYELSDKAELYLRGNYEHISTNTTLASTATAGFTFNIYPNNPFLTASERDAFFNVAANPNLVINPDGSSTIGIRRRIIETGGRVEDHETESYQVVGGVRGDIFDKFKYDVFGQYGRVTRHEVLENDLSYTALTQALDAIPGAGGAVCRDASGGCVPLNVFTTATIPQSQLAFVLRNALQNTVVEQTVVGANVGGDIGFLKSPFANLPAAISIGAEYRREKSSTLVDANFASGDLIYYGQGQNVSGSFNVKELYIEGKMPLVQDKPLIASLNIEGGFRYSRYSTVGTVYTYKGGGDYTPFEGVRFRAIYQRAVRAPNVGELYAPVVAGTGSLASDPCSGRVTAQVQAICIAQGAPASAFSNGVSTVPEPIAAQINIFSGGNPNLKAEQADTFTVGVVVNPPRFRALSFSVDYYSIIIGNAVGNVPASVAINQCYFTDLNANSPSCAGIKRNRLDGSLSGNIIYGVPQVLGNLTNIKTDGIDVSLGYHGGDENGFHYGLAYAGTYIRNYTYQPIPGGANFQCASAFGGDCDLEPMPKYKHVANLTIGYHDFSLVSRWRYLGPVHQDADTSVLVSRISPFNYFDETLSIGVSKRFTFRAGVQNLTDKRPPIIGDTVGNSVAQNLGDTYPNTYDVIGRTYFAGISVGF